MINQMVSQRPRAGRAPSPATGIARRRGRRVRRPRLRRRQGRPHRRAAPASTRRCSTTTSTNKAALYREILRDLFERVAAAVADGRAARRPADEQLRRFIRTVGREAAAPAALSARSGCARWPTAAATSTRRSSVELTARARRRSAAHPRATATTPGVFRDVASVRHADQHRRAAPVLRGLGARSGSDSRIVLPPRDRRPRRERRRRARRGVRAGGAERRAGGRRHADVHTRDPVMSRDVPVDDRSACWRLRSASAPAGATPDRRTAAASGYVEATDDPRRGQGRRAASSAVDVVEGARVAAGDVARRARRRPTSTSRSAARAPSARRPTAQLRLLRAGARPEDIRQAEAQVAAATRRPTRRRSRARRGPRRRSAVRAAAANNAPARPSSATMPSRAASWRKRASQAAADRVGGAPATLARLQGGRARRRRSPPPARASPRSTRRSPSLEHDRARSDDRRAHRPASSRRGSSSPASSSRAGAPLVVIVDLDRAWVNVYVEEPLVPTLQHRSGRRPS